VLGDNVMAASADHVRDHRRHEDRVVELPGNRDEVRNDVERQRKVGNEQGKRDLGAEGNTLILKQTLEEHDAIGDESCNISCIVTTADCEQSQDQ
jgi:hypothetical protein